MIMKKEIFKTLVFKGDRTKVLDRYAILEDSVTKEGLEWYGGNVPRLYPISATIRKLEKQLPDVNFKGVKLITVTIVEMNTNKG